MPRLMRVYRDSFPDLTVEVVERFTNAFNCIAWTIGVRDRWVWNEVDMNQDGYASFSEFVTFYAKHGLVPTPFEGEATVAIFGFEGTGGRLDVKHGARREAGTGFWLSKMGQGGMIRHADLEVFDTSPYGKLLMMFKPSTSGPLGSTNRTPGYMARYHVDSMARDIPNLERITRRQRLPEWAESKLAVARSFLTDVADYGRMN